jgi:peroxiredoxin Q/BCP
MKWMMGLGAALAIAAFAVPGFSQEAKALGVGDKAPEFKLLGTDGKTYSLSQFRGKSAVIVAWYPKALTGG